MKYLFNFVLRLSYPFFCLTLSVDSTPHHGLYLIYWEMENFNISTWLFFRISISLLDFSSMMLSSLSRSWIDFLISFVYLFESSLRFLIIFNSMLLNSLSNTLASLLSLIQMLCCGASLEVKRCLCFSYLNFCTVFCTSVGLIFLLLPWLVGNLLE
jgi:hypothetical protein